MPVRIKQQPGNMIMQIEMRDGRMKIMSTSDSDFGNGDSVRTLEGLQRQAGEQKGKEKVAELDGPGAGPDAEAPDPAKDRARRESGPPRRYTDEELAADVDPKREARMYRRLWYTLLAGIVAAVGAGGICYWRGVLPGVNQAPLVPPAKGVVAGTRDNDVVALERKFPVRLNKRYDDALTGLQTTSLGVSEGFGSFFEFASTGVAYALDADQRAFLSTPWNIEISGLVAKPQTISLLDLVNQMPLEQRKYRHRCVEPWSKVVPWAGFPLAALLDLVEPQAAAQFVLFESFDAPAVSQKHQKHQLGGVDGSKYKWPYVEGLSIKEARHELAFLAIGAYQQLLKPSMGAPLRLVVPWKYAFKSIKSVKAIRFVEEMPTGFWASYNAGAYGFWANVNPAVPHPNWSQAEEDFLRTGTSTTERIKIPSAKFNGYEQYIGRLYDDLDPAHNLWM